MAVSPGDGVLGGPQAGGEGAAGMSGPPLPSVVAGVRKGVDLAAALAAGEQRSISATLQSLPAQRGPEGRVAGRNPPSLPLHTPRSRLLIFYLKYL